MGWLCGGTEGLAWMDAGIAGLLLESGLGAAKSAHFLLTQDPPGKETVLPFTLIFGLPGPNPFQCLIFKSADFKM